LSGKYDIGENTVQDWNGKGWGYITYDLGFEYSSNVAVVNLVNSAINRTDLKECFQKYGFGEKTDIELSRELSGSLNFYYPIEVATASFGQGIATTPIQNLQALSIIANNGKMVKPKIIEKIVNPNTGKTEYEYKLDISEQLVQESTVNKIKELMSNVINGKNEGTTGYYFKVEGADLIGKTGTSQYYDSESGYSTGKNNYVYSFAGMFPKDDPEIIIYASYKNPTWSKNVGLSKMIKSVVKDIAKYHDVGTYNEQNKEGSKYIVESFINKNVEDVRTKLNSYNIKMISVGNGDKIIKQSSIVGSSVVSGDTIIVITNDSNYTMPNVVGWSRKEIISLCNVLGISYEFEGYGYANTQSIQAGSKINEGDTLKVTLNNKIDN
jgi:penicillin-binding protein 2B